MFDELKNLPYLNVYMAEHNSPYLQVYYTRSVHKRKIYDFNLAPKPGSIKADLLQTKKR